MNSRFKFLSTVDPNAVPTNQIKSRFNKLTLSTSTASKMETKEIVGRKETTDAGGTTTATTTTIAVEQNENVKMAIPERIGSKESTTTNSGQRPKILMYESTTTSKNDTNLNEPDILTDDDTNSVSSSIDADFIHTDDTNDDSKSQNVEKMGNQLESLSISMSTVEQQTTQDKTCDDVLNLSHQFSGMDLVRKIGTVNEKVKVECQMQLDETVQNASALTLSSTDSNADESKENADDNSKSSIIVLSDSDNESVDQPPLKIVPRPMEDYNVSSSLPADAVANLPSSSLMHKINKFFDNVPSLNASLNESCHFEKSGEHENESIYVSETTCNDNESENASHSIHEPSIGGNSDKSSFHGDAKVNADLAKHLSALVVRETFDNAIDDELAGVSEMRNVPVTKSSSDQVRSVTSGIKLTTTNSTPIIESTVRNADGVKRSNSNNVSAAVKSSGSSIKFNAGSNGQLNIAAKININIQISNNDSSTSEESSPEASMKDEASLKTPAIESEPIAEYEKHAETVEKPTNESSSDDSTSSLSATQEKSVASSPEQQQQPPATFNRGCNTPKTPSAISRLKSFEFVPPKSMTKESRIDNSSYVTPKRKTAAQLNKENECPEKLPDGFEIDKSIGIDPKDQLLLHQVYGDAWKTPEVLRCYSTVKGRPIANEPMRMVQSAQPSYKSRFSRGFNVFKRNIADDLDSTRWDELSIIEGPAADEISPLKDHNVQELNALQLNLKQKPPMRKEPSMIVEENEIPSPKATPKATPKRKNIKKQSFLASSDDEERINEKISSQSPPSTSTKKKAKSKEKLKYSPADNSQSVLRYKKNTPTVQKRNPPRTPAQVARDRLRKICDSDTDSDGDDDKDEFMTSDEDEYWNAGKNQSSSSTTSESSSDDEFVPRTAKKRGKQMTGTTSTAKKKTSANVQKLVYLDLSSEEVIEVDENHQSNVSEHDLAEVTRKFLESDLNNSAEEKKPDKPLRRKLFTPNYDEFKDDSQVDKIFQIDKRSAIPTNKLNENDEVKLKIPIPIFTSLTNKLFDSKGFAMPKTPAPKGKTENRVDTVGTPKDDPLSATKDTTYTFLKSLDVLTSMRLCHPDAIKYRKNFNANKEELSDILCKLYNNKVFDGKLNTPITWNKKLLTTAGRCHQSSRGGRSARIELSTKVITSSDRLRCTLIHEMCHAAVWLFHGEHGGHGVKWKAWASRCNQVFPELPIIARCHNYNIEFKYTYQCDLCNSKSFSHSKSKKVENIRCSYCHGSISIYLNKKQKDGKIVATPARAATGFAKFVKEKYKEFKEPGIKHAEVMKLISAAFSSLSVEEKKKY